MTHPSFPSSALAEPEDKLLSADEREVALREIRELLFGFSTIAKQLTETGALPAQMTQSVLSCTEFRIAHLAELAGVTIQTQQEMEERYAALRTANTRVQELEQLLGASQDAAQQTEFGLKRLGGLFSQWWEQHGFGYVSKLRFTEHGHLEAECSCALMGLWPLLQSSTPVSDREAKAQWFQILRDRGFVLVQDSDEDAGLVDCDATREALRSLFTQYLPSAVLTETTNHFDRAGQPRLRSVHLYVRKLQEVQDLARHLESQA